MKKSVDEMHETNRRYWDEKLAKIFQDKDDKAGSWRRCVDEPDHAFDTDLPGLMREFVPDLAGKKVCVIASGDNHAVFAFAGMGAEVTSTDQSVAQLEVAEQRARELGVDVTFAQSDAANMAAFDDASFDIVVSTNGFYVWVADPPAVCREVSRILKPGGYYFFFDIHPFLRPWDDDQKELTIAKAYGETGPLVDEKDGFIYFHWTVADLLNAIAGSGLILKRMKELPPKNASFWENGNWYGFKDEPDLFDWKINPLAALPTWLAVASQKPV